MQGQSIQRGRSKLVNPCKLEEMLALQGRSQFWKISAASSVGWCLTITSFFHPFLTDLALSEEDDKNHGNVAIPKEAARILTVKVLCWVFSLRTEVAEVSWKGWSALCCRGRHWFQLCFLEMAMFLSGLWHTDRFLSSANFIGRRFCCLLR